MIHQYLRIRYLLIAGALYLLLSPVSFAQTTSIKRPEFEAIAKKMLKALKKMDQAKFLECFMSREEFEAFSRARGERIDADKADVTYMKAARKYADNFFLLAKKNDADEFSWAEMNVDSIVYNIIKSKNKVLETDIYLYTSILEQPYKITLRDVIKVDELPWKIANDCRMKEIPTKAEMIKILAEREEKLKGVNQTIRLMLQYYKTVDKTAYILLAGTETDQESILEKMKLPGATNEEMEETRKKLRLTMGQKYEQKTKETGAAFKYSTELIKEKRAMLSEAEIVWNLPAISEQMGIKVADANGFIRDHSVYFTFHINLVEINGKWLINHPSPLSFVTQNSSVATMIDDIISNRKYYKKL
ncbi:MAG: hypothetical protein COB85_03165 [Bacteroidetes bacterium]|nr:MAG: hypothetical protein COB85_03165 [Bacteroidota bacterium]